MLFNFLFGTYTGLVFCDSLFTIALLNTGRVQEINKVVDFLYRQGWFYPFIYDTVVLCLFYLALRYLVLDRATIFLALVGIGIELYALIGNARLVR
jgi:hypothetical protein